MFFSLLAKQRKTINSKFSSPRQTDQNLEKSEFSSTFQKTEKSKYHIKIPETIQTNETGFFHYQSDEKSQFLTSRRSRRSEINLDSFLIKNDGSKTDRTYERNSLAIKKLKNSHLERNLFFSSKTNSNNLTSKSKSSDSKIIRNEISPKFKNNYNFVKNSFFLKENDDYNLLKTKYLISKIRNKAVTLSDFKINRPEKPKLKKVKTILNKLNEYELLQKLKIKPKISKEKKIEKYKIIIDFISKSTLNDLFNIENNDIFIKENIISIFPEIFLNKSNKNHIELLFKNGDKIIRLLKFNPTFDDQNQILSENYLENFSNYLDIKNFGIAQTSLSEKKTEFSEKQKIDAVKTIKTETEILKNRLKEKILAENYGSFAVKNNPKINEITIQEIHFLRSEFILQEPNFSKIDKIIKRLKFFSRFNKNIRMLFLKKSNFLEYNEGETIFKEGDFGDLMYVIIRGAVNIVIGKKLDNFSEIKHQVVVNSFYDGDYFGDLAMLSTQKESLPKSLTHRKLKLPATISDLRKKLQIYYDRETSSCNDNKARYSISSTQETLGIKKKDNQYERTKRSASVITAEATQLLAISRKEYQYIYLNILKKGLEDKMDVLTGIQPFSELEPFLLLPFANILEERKCELNEKIIEKGELIETFYIVAQGKCDLIFEMEFIETDIKTKKTSFISQRKGISPKNKIRANKNLVNFHNFVSENKNDNNIQIKKGVLGTFFRGDIFCERALLNNTDLETKKKNFNKNFKYSLFSKVSIISDSNETLLYTVNKEKFEIVPNDIKAEIKNILIDIQEFDDIDIDKLEGQEENWMNFSKSTYRNCLKIRQQKKENNLFKLSHND